MVQTVDLFTPVVDDPFDFGRIAAANALSDIYAMGAARSSRFARRLSDDDAARRSPRSDPPRRRRQGGEARIAIVGGHSIDDDNPQYGLAVTGLAAEERIQTNAGARPGDRLVLTKPLGIGVTVCAGRAGRPGRGGDRPPLSAAASSRTRTSTRRSRR